MPSAAPGGGLGGASHGTLSLRGHLISSSRVRARGGGSRALFAFFVFFLVLCLGQSVVVMGVVCLMVAPFWAVKTVGIFSLVAQRFPFGAASAEYGPWGSVSSKLVPTGWSGTVANVLLVIPLLMNVSPCRSTVTP